MKTVQHPGEVARPMVMTTVRMDRLRLPFEVDAQTLRDIDLFDQGGVGPVFTFFCRVKTTGGAEALEQLLKTPSNDRLLLEGRRDAIQFFQDKGVDLPIGREQLKKIEHYLSSFFPLFPDSRMRILIFSVRKQLKKASAFSTIIRGIRTTVSLLRHLFLLREDWLEKGCPAMLAKELEGLPELITDRKLRQLIQGASRHLTMTDLARCDRYFRGKGKPLLRQLLKLLYEWDAFEAVAKVAQQYDLCFPQYDDADAAGPAVEVRGLFHPLLNNPVVNDLEMGEEAGLCVISGAHMAGKTTFLKSFGLAIYLAHTGFPVPARSIRTTLLNGLITSIDLTETIHQGYSHFYAEVRRLGDIVHRMKEGRRMAVIMDELFRGTNMNDACETLPPVIDGLARVKENLVLISTNIVEIAERMQRNPKIRFTCLASTMEGGLPWYTYQLRDGVCDEKMGLRILQDEGIMDMLDTARMCRKYSNL